MGGKGMNDLPLVSILMPSYNHADFIAAAIESVLSQTFSNIELIIVDDGSTDDTPVIAQKFATEHPERITFIRREFNKGVPATWNEALSHAKGDYLIPFASDDLLPPTAVEDRLNYMLTHPEVDILVTDFQVLTEEGLLLDGEKKHALVPQFNRMYEIDWSKLYEELLSGNFIAGGTLMIRLEDIKLEDLFQDPGCPNLSDYDLWLRLSKKYTWAYLPIPTWIYRWHGRNLSHPANLQNIPDIILSQIGYILSKQLVQLFQSQSPFPRERLILTILQILLVQLRLLAHGSWRMQILRLGVHALLIWRLKGFRGLLRKANQKMRRKIWKSLRLSSDP
jgi:glycosyltransferase involved in cell wall biosynthesis